MASKRTATSGAVRRHLLSLCGRARATNCCFISREDGRRIILYGKPPEMSRRAPSKSLTSKTLFAFLFPIDYDPSVTSVSETKLSSSVCTTADFSLMPKSKPDFFVSSYDKDERHFFTAYSVAEDGIISPKYYFYPPSPINEGWYFTGYCFNGILHFQGGNEENLLWNPTTNEFIIIPKTLDPPPRVNSYHIACGMWSDPSCQDFKVLQFVLTVLEDEEGECIEQGYEIDLYSLKSNSWKKIRCSGIVIMGRDDVCINGVFYSLITQEGESDRVILAFDFSTETLSTIRLPSYDSRPDFLELIEYRGLFSVLVGWADKSGPWKHELLVMEKEGCWTRETVFHTCGVRRPLCFSQNGELLYFASFDEQVLQFDRVTGKLKHLGIHLWSDGTRLVPFYASSVRLSVISDVKVRCLEPHYIMYLDQAHNIEQEPEGEEDGYVIT